MKLEMTSYEERMKKALSVYAENLSSMRAGRANPNALNRITVDYYGSPTPITGVAAVSISDARTLVIQPWDSSTVKEIEKAILASDLGITPQNDGRTIRLIFPQLTEERRREIKKQVQKYAEDAKVAIRNIRRDANEDAKKQKKDGILTEDEQKAAEKTIQDITDKCTKKIEEILAKKEKEIMEI